MLQLTGKLIRVREYRGEPKNVVGRVVSVRDTQVDWLAHQTVRRNTMPRSRYLVKVVCEADGTFRDYYDSFLAYKQVSLFGSIVIRVSAFFKQIFSR